LRVSGIISIVVYALYMNVFGKTIITGEVNKYVNTFWSYIVFVAETGIFLIAGVNIGVKVMSFNDLDFHDEISITLYVYSACFFARFIAITVFMKWLKNMGYGMNLKEALIIAYTGLKGAIGISLAMMVYENSNYSLKMRHLTLFITAGNSILSLAINGGTAGFLVKLFGLSTLTKI
jgi:NhaP-type Na+/H+ or K+/H+ antiporter